MLRVLGKKQFKCTHDFTVLFFSKQIAAVLTAFFFLLYYIIFTIRILLFGRMWRDLVFVKFPFLKCDAQWIKLETEFLNASSLTEVFTDLLR